MDVNFVVIFLAALVPMIIGFVWYHPSVMGRAWMKASGMNEEQIKGANLPLIFGLCFLFAFMLSFSLQFNVVHQYHLYSIVADQVTPGDTTSAAGQWLQTSFDNYGSNFRTFKHGAFHGFLMAIFLVLPLIGTHALYERKGARYIFVHTGFWAINFTLMGGIISQWA
jgi:hypothetical protein